MSYRDYLVIFGATLLLLITYLPRKANAQTEQPLIPYTTTAKSAVCLDPTIFRELMKKYEMELVMESEGFGEDKVFLFGAKNGDAVTVHIFEEKLCMVSLFKGTRGKIDMKRLLNAREM